jgi:hypothetical protein
MALVSTRYGLIWFRRRCPFSLRSHPVTLRRWHVALVGCTYRTKDPSEEGADRVGYSRGGAELLDPLIERAKKDIKEGEVRSIEDVKRIFGTSDRRE